MPPLTDTAIRNAGLAAKPYKLFDTGGLYLLVKPNGARAWRLKYRVHGRENLLGFGHYPEVSLRTAREQRDDAKRLIRAGIDPSVQRKIDAGERINTFKAVALEWLHLLEHPPQNPKSKKPAKPPLSASTIAAKRRWLDDHVFPYIGARPINAIEPPELLSALKRIEKRGIFETTHRACSTCSKVFRYGIATGKCKRDPTADLRGALTPVVVTHHAALIDPRAVGTLLRAIDAYRGQPVTRLALKLLPLVFLRSSELRWSTWSQIDFQAAEWRIPARNMKMKEMHIVPLAQQALELLHELQSLTGTRPLMFEGQKVGRPISENTVNNALRLMGYAGHEMTGHGFRTVASTFLNEQGWNQDLIELQLAHSERDETRAAYNRAQRLAERRKMMQAWADIWMRFGRAMHQHCEETSGLKRHARL